MLTLCFIKYKDKVLLINRNKSPFMGLWNAIGGHGLENEQPLDCAKRETFEESGLLIDNFIFHGISTWNFDDDTTYVFSATLPDDFDITAYPKKINEGIIDFKDIDWVLNNKNQGVVSDLFVYLQDIKDNTSNNYYCVFDDDGRLISYSKNS